MNYSRQRAVSDGTLITLDISLSYFKRENLTVLLDGVLTTAWEWVGALNTIKFPLALPKGIEVTVQRSTQRDKVIHEFAKGAAFTSRSMDEDFRQMLYLAQEYMEGAAQTDFFHGINMHGFGISNLKDGVLPGDAVNLRQLNEVAGGAPAAAEEARQAASAALTAAARADMLRIDLGSPAGATFVKYAVESDAPRRGIDSLIRDHAVSVKDWGAVGDGIADDTVAIQKCIDLYGSVWLPSGIYRTTQTLRINKPYFTFAGAGFGASIIKPDGSTLGIAIADSAHTTGISMSGFKVQCNATSIGGIRLGSELYYAALIVIKNVHVWDASRVSPMSGFGLQLVTVQNVDIENCWFYRCRYGVHRPNIGYATSTKIHGKAGYLGGGVVGIYVDGFFDDLYLDDVVVEGNSSAGIAVTANAVRADRASSIYCSKLYIELNGADGNGGVVAQGGAGMYQTHVVVLDKCYFAAGTLPKVNFDKVIGTISNCKLTPGEVRLTASCTTMFRGNKHPTGSNFLTEYRALLGNVSVQDMVDANLSTDLNQINMFTGITFPDVPRLVNDERTLDDYHEVVNGQWTPAYGLITGTDIVVTGGYVKIGRLVTVNIRVTGTDLATLWTASAVYLPYATDFSTVCSLIFVGASGSSPTGISTAYVDASADAILIPTRAAESGSMFLNLTYLSAA